MDEPMCRGCQDGIDTMQDNIAQMVARHQYAVLGVSASPSFHYTVGLTDMGLPEFIIFSMPYSLGHQIITAMMGLVHRNGLPALDQPFDDIATASSKLVRVLPKYFPKYCMQAINYSGNLRAVLQIMWPDAQGIFADEPGFDERFCPLQPVLSR